MKYRLLVVFTFFTALMGCGREELAFKGDAAGKSDRHENRSANLTRSKLPVCQWLAQDSYPRTIVGTCTAYYRVGGLHIIKLEAGTDPAVDTLNVLIKHKSKSSGSDRPVATDNSETPVSTMTEAFFTYDAERRELRIEADREEQSYYISFRPAEDQPLPQPPK